MPPNLVRGGRAASRSPFASSRRDMPGTARSRRTSPSTAPLRRRTRPARRSRRCVRRRRRSRNGCVCPPGHTRTERRARRRQPRPPPVTRHRRNADHLRAALDSRGGQRRQIIPTLEHDGVDAPGAALPDEVVVRRRTATRRRIHDEHRLVRVRLDQHGRSVSPGSRHVARTNASTCVSTGRRRRRGHRLARVPVHGGRSRWS
jgi:hypothetical protein